MKFTDTVIPILERTGLSAWESATWTPKDITLRDGTAARLWVHPATGHGVLDPACWEGEDYYRDEYRKEFTADLERATDAAAHFDLYAALNRRQFDLFSHLVGPDTRYLEVGCSFGGVLDLVRRAGAGVLHAVEPNRDDAAFVQSRQPDVVIHNGYLEESRALRQDYNLVASFEVLEHVPDPGSFLRILCRIMSPDAWLTLEVPNHDDALLSRFRSPRYQSFYYHKAHLHYFTHASLQRLTAESGLAGRVSGFQMYPFYNQLWWAFNDKPQGSAREALSLLQLKSAGIEVED